MSEKVANLMGDDSAIIGYRDGIPVLDPNKVLENAMKQNLKEVLILGWDEDDCLFSAGSAHKTSDILLIIEFFKHKMLNGDYQLD